VASARSRSFHADTHVRARDQQGLERLCRYGSHGPLALERLSAREDGKDEYRTRRGPVLVFTAAQLVKRLLALLPPRGAHLTRFHGCSLRAPSCARGWCVRATVRIRPHPPDGAKSASAAAPERENRRPRVDWAFLQRHTFEADVWQCPCGGRRTLLAVVTRRATAEEVLQNLGQGSARRPRATGHSLPQARLAL
jgi:hypothetical protein